jgi:pimeloyl-ACP methyl ester carboxylesterase
VIEFVDTGRGRFAVEMHGRAEAPPVVLIAGLGDDHTSWEPVLPYLAPARRCVTFDNRGIGRSPITPGPYRIAELAEDAHALHRALGLAPCIAIGSSMGGAICQEWAIRHPGDVSGIVLSNSIDGFAAAAAACHGHDALWGLRSARPPALVLAGRHDILTRPELSAELADTLPAAELQFLEAGHMTFWEVPGDWGRAVTRWLDERGPDRDADV